ncbi:hypothetical protein Y032_0181g863 [Ancylostoma ceylanicum]|uniref:Uncharacterized protein n=1 Tax=Ancylostoma ceylanicum TaxID=53326 RepID=A0A016ST69_9BILA|nr:hypothetical protein Y032_0181g863 [Ancylostoma ceylanicum]
MLTLFPKMFIESTKLFGFYSFVPSSNLGPNGQLQKHSSRPTSMMVCPQQCWQQFDNRNVLNNPVPQAAIYNNRQSSRFDGLYGYYRV